MELIQGASKLKGIAQMNGIEKAITHLISGLDCGYVKCSFGIAQTVMNYGSYTMTEDEAISMYCSSYSKIRLLAEEGDTEAMVMVAEGIRYGFVEDDNEPYLFWLTKAAELGDEWAIALMQELDLSDDPWALPSATSVVTNEARESMDATDMLLLDDSIDLDIVDDGSDIYAVPEEHVLVAEPDWVMREQYGINDYFREKERDYELRKCRDDQVVD